MRILSVNRKSNLIKCRWEQGDRIFGKDIPYVVKKEEYGMYLARTGKNKHNGIKRKKLKKAS